MKDNGLKYITGYVAFRFKKQHPHLGLPTKDCTFTDIPPWIHTMSRGRLIYPSNDMIKLSKIVEEEFQKYHGSFLSLENYIFNRLTDIVVDRLESESDSSKLNISRPVIHCLVRTRTYLRLKFINQERSLARHEKKMKRIEKNKKFTNRNDVNTNSNNIFNT